MIPSSVLLMIASSDDATIAASSASGGGAVGSDDCEEEGIERSDAGTPSTTRPGSVTVKVRQLDPRLRGTFAPFCRASERPIAIACLRLVTRPPLPPRPLFSVPRLRRRIALSTRLLAARPYRGIISSSVLGVIRYSRDATFARAMRAAVERPVRLDPVSHDLAATMGTGRSELVNCAFKTVEGIGRPVAYDIEREVVLVSADFTFRHGLETPRSRKCSGSDGVKPCDA